MKGQPKSGLDLSIPTVTVSIDTYSADRNTRVPNFKVQTVEKTMFLDHCNLAIMPFVQNWPLIIASQTPIDANDTLVTLPLPARVCYRIGNAKGNVNVSMSVEIDTLEWVIHCTEDTASSDAIAEEWIHHEAGTREYKGFGDYGIRDNETGELVIDIEADVREILGNEVLRDI